MNKSTVFLSFLLFFSYNVLAQRITISGYVTEKKSGERLPGAIVFLPNHSAGTATNTFGFYSITIAKSDSLEISASYTGYQLFMQRVKADKNIELNIKLEDQKDLKEVVITAQKDDLQRRTQMSAIDLPIETIKSLPAFLGEADVMKAIQLLPGIQGGTEGTTGIYVRGGSADQNLILLDGVPVYNASHLFGFFSVFNTDAIRNVEVIKGGFPAHYSGRLSSVIDINMKDGDNNKFHGEGGVGLIASRLTLEGPIQKGKSSFMISGRRTYYDVLTQPFIKGPTKGGYYFYDLNGKVNFTLGKRDHLYVSGYFGNDKFYLTDNEGSAGNATTFKTNLQWGNTTAVARWNHEFSPKLFGNLTTYYSRYQFLISAENINTNNGVTDDYLSKYHSGINDKAVKYDFDYYLNPSNSLKAGIGGVAHTYSPGAAQTKITSPGQTQDTTVGQQQITANEYDAYIEDDISFTSRLKANIGVHWAGFNVRNTFYNSVQPRVAARYLLNDKVSLKASFVQMNQYINLLSNSSVGLPTDLWVPVTDRIPPQLSHQAAVGVAYTYDHGIEMSLEGYYKTMNNVLEYKEGASFFNNTTTWEDKVDIGNGKSYGIEMFIQKKKGRLTGLAGYTLSWSNRTFADLNNGQTFPYRYDRRNDLKIAAIYSLKKNIEVSAEWVYGTGNAITLPIGSYMGQDGQEVQVFGSRNGFREPAYHRADVSIKFTKEMRRWNRAWIISVYNVYNHQNPFFIYEEQGSFQQVSLFPIIPTISYQFSF